jgi:hemerythrin/septum formation topological specificity factor MinE
MSKGLGFDKLREILLEKDWEERDQLAQKLEDLDDQINSRNRLEEKIQPILADERTNLKNKFPELFGPQITESISKQIRESQDEVVEALYPIIGRMIKKYITSEMEKLSEKVDHQMELAFSWEGWKIRIKAWISGTPQKDMMISKLIEPKIEEIYVIERNSGMLLGSFSKNASLDRDMVAGMLTAIKAFVEDAFTGETQELSNIDYDNFKITIKNFKSFFVAVVTSGGMNAHFRDKLDDTLLDFAQKVLKKAKEGGDANQQTEISEGLEKYFENFDKDE